MRLCSLFMAGVGAVWILSGQVRGDNWPQFRGSNGAAVSSDSSIPIEWSADKNIAWKVKLPGYGWSCPIVWGDKVFVTTAISEKQQKPLAGFGTGGPGGAGGFQPGGRGGRPPGFGGPPQPGQIL